MNTIIFVAGLPVVLILYYIYYKDSIKEPKNMLTKVLLWGCFSIIPIVLAELFVDNFVSIQNKNDLFGLIIYCFISVGFIEELGKWLVLNKVIYNHNEFNQTYDAIVYSTFASLGFALVENILYVLSNGIVTGVARAFTAIPAHTCTGILMGYFLGKAKISELKLEKNNSNKYMLYSILTPILAHSIYDAIAFSDLHYTVPLFIIYTIAMYIISIKLIKKSAKENINFYNNVFNLKENYIFALKYITIIALLVLGTHYIMKGLL